MFESWKAIIADPTVFDSTPKEIIDQFGGWDWALLISRYPDFIEHADTTHFTGSMWHAVLIEQPQLMDYVAWDMLSQKQRQHLVELYPQLAKFSLLYI